MKKRLNILVIVGLIIVMTLSACQKKLELYRDTFYETFDTSIDYLSYKESKEAFSKEFSMVQKEFERLHKLYDNFRNYDGITNVKTINDNAGKGPVKVEKDLFDVIKFSKDNYDKTNGKMNIAMGNVIKLWNDARIHNTNGGKIVGDSIAEKDKILPSKAQLDEVRKHMDINDVIIDEKNLTVELKDPQMTIDLGAIGKGYATELVAKKLEENGTKHASINAGGNVRAIGTPGDGRKTWGFGIQNPDLGSSENLEELFIGETSLVTSGDYQRYFEKDGKKYHHIIDPNTLYPGGEFSSVSIVTKDSGVADLLSTVIFLSSKEEAKSILENYKDVGVIWYSKDGVKTSTDNIKEFMKSEGAKPKK